MRQCAHLSRRGFTLLEMCIVFFIIAIFLGAMMPAMESAFIEQAVRKDSRQLSLMIKTAMIQSDEQHRPYEIDFSGTTMWLHPVGETVQAADPDTSFSDVDFVAKNDAPEDVAITCELDKPNKLLVPDPDKPNAWMDMPPTAWVFQPGDLCPATRVRLARGTSWLEMNFNALTGNVDTESTYFP